MGMEKMPFLMGGVRRANLLSASHRQRPSKGIEFRLETSHSESSSASPNPLINRSATPARYPDLRSVLGGRAGGDSTTAHCIVSKTCPVRAPYVHSRGRAPFFHHSLSLSAHTHSLTTTHFRTGRHRSLSSNRAARTNSSGRLSSVRLFRDPPQILTYL